ncbi:MAG: NFACT family protein [Chloroflexota bacterium]|nr:NFACT family protein [Chloroflexota bacterium]
MSFDALTLSAVRDELEPLLTGARVQKLVFPDALSLAIEVFSPQAGRTNVLLSAHLDDCRIQRIPHLPARGLERDTPFSLVARKHLRNARIRSIRQPRLERVFELDCEQRDASLEHYRFRFIVEVMGRRSNLVLVDQDGDIMDAARRTPPSRNSRRPILPHLPYAPPPPQDRLFPEQLSSESLAAAATDRSGPLARFLSDRIAGLSPLAGREIAFRATGAATTPLADVDWRGALEATLAFMSMEATHAWEPTLALEDQRPAAFAPYRLRHLEAAGATLQAFETISDAIDAYYARLADVGPARRGDPLRAERTALLAPLQRATQAIQRRISALEHQLASGQGERDPLRRGGEQILAHQLDLPPGATELSVDGERYELDPRLTAVENAQAYFARYRKAREAEARVPVLLEEAEQHAEHLAELHTLVEVADQMDAIRALRREVGAASGGKAQPDVLKTPKSTHASRQVARAAPYRRVSLGEGWEALLGTSAAGNAHVTFDLGQADDVWLHARGVPGAHVILRTNGAAPPESVVHRAAQLAAWHSGSREAGAVEVDVAQRRYVRKIPNGRPGTVRYANERTVRVAPSAEP